MTHTIIDSVTKEASTVYPYHIRHRPNGKWALYADGVFIVDFPTRKEAEDGMKRCITPEIYNYDELGNDVP